MLRRIIILKNECGVGHRPLFNYGNRKTTNRRLDCDVTVRLCLDNQIVEISDTLPSGLRYLYLGTNQIVEIPGTLCNFDRYIVVRTINAGVF